MSGRTGVTFYGNFIYSPSFCQKSAERENPRRNIFIFSYWCLSWDLNLGLMSTLRRQIKVKWSKTPINLYIHNIIVHYNTSLRIIDLVSHPTYVVCVNFFLYISGSTCSLKSTPEDRFFEQLFMVILFTLCWEGKSSKKYFHIFVLMSDLEFELGPYV